MVLDRRTGRSPTVCAAHWIATRPPDGGPGSLVLVSGVGLLHTSQNQEGGLKFIEYLLHGHVGHTQPLFLPVRQ